FHVWDRPSMPLLTMYGRAKEIEKMPDGAEKKARMDQLRKEAPAPRRVFLGRSQDGSAGITLADREGKTRIALMVDANNKPVLRFMDESGKVVQTFPAN